MTDISPQLIQEQILGLQRAQSAVVWIRRDIVVKVLGEKEAEHFDLHNIDFKEEWKFSKKQLLRAGKDHNPTRHTGLVCVPRAEILEAIIDAVAHSNQVSPRNAAEALASAARKEVEGDE